MIARLNSKQHKAIILLASGKLKKDVAEAVKVTPQTISQWLRDPNFEASLNSLKWEQIKSARGSLQALTVDAVNTLAKVMAESDSYETKRRAAMDILAMAGLSGDNEVFGWGIGEASVEGIERDRESKRMQQALIDSLVGY